MFSLTVDELEFERSIPKEVRRYLKDRRAIPLGINPMEGSFVNHFSRSKSPYEDYGHSICERVLEVLVYREKLRRAQVVIAARMNPREIYTAENASRTQLHDLRDQIALADYGADHKIIANYPITHEQIGVQDKLLDLSSEYDITDNQLFVGLGMTRELLTGEGLYSGARISFQVLNYRYSLLREDLAKFLEEKLFKPLAKKRNLVKNGVYLYPRVRFTRTSVPDAQDLWEILYNLFKDGALPVDILYDFLGFDKDEIQKRLSENFISVLNPDMKEFVVGKIQGLLEESGSEEAAPAKKEEEAPAEGGEDMFADFMKGGSKDIVKDILETPLKRKNVDIYGDDLLSSLLRSKSGVRKIRGVDSKKVSEKKAPGLGKMKDRKSVV